jgi:hypothetical protein
MVGARAQQRIEAEAVLGSLDLLRAYVRLTVVRTSA